MAQFINDTSGLGTAIIVATQNWTGSLFLTLFIIMILLMFLALALRFPIELTAVIIIPLCLGFMAYYQDFYGPGGIILIYAGILVAKNWFFK